MENRKEGESMQDLTVFMDSVSLGLAKLCGFFFQLHICMTHSRLFISAGMVEPQDRTNYFIERFFVFWLCFFFKFAGYSCVSDGRALTWYLVCSRCCTISFCSSKKALLVCLGNQGEVAQALWPASSPAHHLRACKSNPAVITSTFLCSFGWVSAAALRPKELSQTGAGQGDGGVVFPGTYGLKEHLLGAAAFLQVSCSSPPTPFLFSRSICGRAGSCQGRGLMKEEVGWLVCFFAVGWVLGCVGGSFGGFLLGCFLLDKWMN